MELYRLCFIFNVSVIHKQDWIVPSTSVAIRIPRCILFSAQATLLYGDRMSAVSAPYISTGTLCMNVVWYIPSWNIRYASCTIVSSIV